MSFLEDLKQRNIDGIEGLYIVIVQDAESKEVLMQAFANRQAIEKTLESGLAHYFSTSRKKLWLKGESSGNTQKVLDMLWDCDLDAVIYLVEQKTAACHKGYRSCFFQRVVDGGLVIESDRLFDPDEVYKK